MSLLVRNPNIYYGGARKRRVGRPRVRRHGGSFFGSIGNALSKAHDFIKNNKIISTVGNALGAVGVPYAGAIGKAASTLGYGRRRRRVVRHRRRGGALNIRGLLSKVHGFVKGNQLVSKGLNHFGHSKLAGIASSAGYGRRKRTVRRRRRRVGGSLRSILSKVHGFVKGNQLVSKGLSHFGHSKLAGLASSAGYGRRRRITRRAPIRRMVRHRGGANFFSTEQIAVPRF